MSAHGRYGAWGTYGAAGVDPVSVIFSSITDLVTAGGGIAETVIANRGSTAQLRAKLVQKQGQLAKATNPNRRSKLVAEIQTLQMQLAAAQQAEFASMQAPIVVSAPTPSQTPPSSSVQVPAWAPYAVGLVALGIGAWVLLRRRQ